MHDVLKLFDLWNSFKIIEKIACEAKNLKNIIITVKMLFEVWKKNWERIHNLATIINNWFMKKIIKIFIK